MDIRWFSVLALTLAGLHAQAQTSIDKGDWLIRLGGTIIDPSSSGLFVDATITDPESSEPIGVSGTVTADSDASATFNTGRSSITKESSDRAISCGSAIRAGSRRR